MTRRKRWLIHGGIVCVIAAAGAVVLSIIAPTSPYPDVRQPPAEVNRVVHPLGFSIVKPGRTRAIVARASSVGDDQIAILPDGGRSRYHPALSVRRLRKPPDHSRLEREGFQSGAFQEHNAFIYNGPSGKYHAYRVVTNRAGEWYEIALLVPGVYSPEESVPSPQWQRYLETFAPAPTTRHPAARHNPTQSRIRERHFRDGRKWREVLGLQVLTLISFSNLPG